MKKRILNISTAMQVDHSKDSIGEALGADYDEARRIALSTVKYEKASEAVEDMIFNHNVPIQTRFLAVFVAGVIRGQMQGPKPKIIIKRPKTEDFQ